MRTCNVPKLAWLHGGQCNLNYRTVVTPPLLSPPLSVFQPELISLQLLGPTFFLPCYLAKAGFNQFSVTSLQILERFYKFSVNVILNSKSNLTRECNGPFGQHPFTISKIKNQKIVSTWREIF